MSEIHGADGNDGKNGKDEIDGIDEIDGGNRHGETYMYDCIYR